MTSVRELEVFKRAVGGDFTGRNEFFKTFIWNSARVRRLGIAYRDLNDFLHDCFINAMRTSHTFNQANGNLGQWVESVAAWTALEHQRQRDAATSDDGQIRLRAALENDEPDGRARLASYVPPRSVPNDTLMERIASLVGEPQFTALTCRGLENRTWEDTAAAVSRPLSAIGPFVLRAVDRLVRFFGAPPPLNDDFEPVFANVVRERANTRRLHPPKIRGRIYAMQLDAPFYAVTPEMRKIGLSVPAEVRTMVLWDAARSSSPPDKPLRDHLAECRYCAELLRALLLMQGALAAAPGAGFLLCPGACTLLETAGHSEENDSRKRNVPIEQHVGQCQACREERAGAVAAGLGVAQTAAAGRRKEIAFAAAALLLLLGAGTGYLLDRPATVAPRADKPKPLPATKLPPADFSVPPAAPAAPVAPVAADPRLKGLAQNVKVEDQQWIASVLPQDMDAFDEALLYIHKGNLPLAMTVAGPLAARDPGLQMLYAFCLYGQQSSSEGYQGMLRAEAMPPRNPFRCWATMQCALILGDMDVAAREADHLAADPQYGARAKDLLARARQLTAAKTNPAPATR